MMRSIAGHRGNVNQNHNWMECYTTLGGEHQEDEITSAGEDVGEREPVHCWW